jgi:hypothetical protein
MAINPISRDEFDAYEPFRAPGVEMLADEQEWYADDFGNVLGSVIRDKVDDDWSYVILGRDERGRFRAIDVDSSIETRQRASTELLRKMAELETSGELDFPQGD